MTGKQYWLQRIKKTVSLSFLTYSTSCISPAICIGSFLCLYNNNYTKYKYYFKLFDIICLSMVQVCTNATNEINVLNDIFGIHVFNESISQGMGFILLLFIENNTTEVSNKNKRAKRGRVDFYSWIWPK